MEYKPNKNCKYCEGTGEVCVANGPDDFDRAVCDCVEKQTLTEEIMSFLYDQGKKLK